MLDKVNPQHVKIVSLPNNKTGLAAKTVSGLYTLTALSKQEPYNTWKTLRLPLWDNLVHSLIEE